MAARPFIFVLAGVNGAGKSSIGGARLRAVGLDWYNPDRYARLLMQETGCSPEEANGQAWQYGRDKLEAAIRQGLNFAFETTLGARTIPAMLKEASATHDVRLWFCGLTSVELHIERVAHRVASGGHAIPEAKIRERWDSSRLNLVELIPFLATLQLYDNSVSVLPGEQVPPPKLLLHKQGGKVIYPKTRDVITLSTVPDWAKPILQAVFESSSQVS
jgi:predicted ABC-type ATPase